MNDRTCAFPGCEVDRRGGGRGWCRKHYQKWYRYGDPGTPDRKRSRADGMPVVDGQVAHVPLTRGYVALIDASDADLVASVGMWHVVPDDHTFYAAHSSRPLVLLHRLILGLDHGDPRYGDHINHDGLDNRRCNLRVLDSRASAVNTRAKPGGSSHYKGVSWKAANRKWVAQVAGPEGKQHLGLFDDETEAARAYDAAASMLFGPAAYLNFPESA